VLAGVFFISVFIQIWAILSHVLHFGLLCSLFGQVRRCADLVAAVGVCHWFLVCCSLPFSIPAQVKVSAAQPTSGSADQIVFFVPWSFFPLNVSGVHRWLILGHSAWKTLWFSLPACLSFSSTEILFLGQALGPWAKLIFPVPWFFFAGCAQQQ
jgi:hypothetical protein